MKFILMSQNEIDEHSKNNDGIYSEKAYKVFGFADSKDGSITSEMIGRIYKGWGGKYGYQPCNTKIGLEIKDLQLIIKKLKKLNL